MRYLTTLVLISSLWLIDLSAARAQEATLTGNIYQTVNVRSGPDTQFEIITQLEADTTVMVNGRESEATRWLRIVLEVEDAAGEPFGWVTAFSVMLDGDPSVLAVIDHGPTLIETPPDAHGTPAPDARVMVMAYGRVNVRSGPSITYEVIGQLEIDDEAPALARSNAASDWLYVERDELAGWVAFFTVTVMGDPAQLPVRVPDGSSSDLVPPSALVTSRYNVRLRREPALRAPVVGLIPFDHPASPLAQTEDGRWLYVAFESSEGWALAQLFDVPTAQRALIPVYTPASTPSPAPAVTTTPTGGG
jgi:uncharacterized protein YraI